MVEVKLASDAIDPATKLLTADVGIVAPLQDFIISKDANVHNKVQVLGILVDIGQASLEGADDGDNAGESFKHDL